jgi:Asp-tRNA(Asn)/Glu-tRNA(Gln) amidotransferase C subunit
MKDAVRKLSDEYGFKLTEKEIDIVAQQAEESALLFKPLFEVDLDRITPLTKVDKRLKKIPATKRGKK